MAAKAKEFRYAIGLDRTGRVTAEGQSPLDLDAAWTPEHLVLAGLVRCTLQSLRFHATPLEIDFVASGSATALITRRPDDGRYGFVEIDVKLQLARERCRSLACGSEPQANSPPRLSDAIRDVVGVDDPTLHEVVVGVEEDLADLVAPLLLGVLHFSVGDDAPA